MEAMGANVWPGHRPCSWKMGGKRDRRFFWQLASPASSLPESRSSLRAQDELAAVNKCHETVAVELDFKDPARSGQVEWALLKQHGWVARQRMMSVAKRSIGAVGLLS